LVFCGAAILAFVSPSICAAQSSQAAAPEPPATQLGPRSKPPPAHRLSSAEAIDVAERNPEVVRAVKDHPQHTSAAYAIGPGLWKVAYFDAHDREVARVIVAESPAKVLHIWTGDQVAWEMARGTPGAFGRKVSAAYVWIPLMCLFFFAFFDWRKPLRLVHLDLLVLLSFALSQYFFNRGEIGMSVPLVYPPLLYLLIRMLAVVYVPGLRQRIGTLRPIIPVAYLLIALLFVCGFRVGLNIADSNVIDVGYSGVIGADRITHGRSPYGSFPFDNSSGDTYGPVAYYAYVPAELALPWRGRWDDLPAAHASAVAFDLLTMVALFAVGRRFRRGREGTTLGISLAFAWAAFPYTLYAMNSNVNDSLVATTLAFSFLALASPLGRGALLALSTATKFAPLLLAPLYASYDRRRLRDALLFAAAFIPVILLVTLPLIPDGGLREMYDRTIGLQLGRSSPFSIWGRHDRLQPVQTSVEVCAVALALLAAFRPRRKTVIDVAALGAAILIATQITFTHWFYTYIVWWLPFVLAVLILPPTAEQEKAPVR
jgi:hypothetical protein